MSTVTVSSKDKITIPAQRRASLGLRTGDRVEFIELSRPICNVGIYTVAVGGVMLVLETASYLFSRLDAVWLSNALIEAIGEEPLDFQEA